MSKTVTALLASGLVAAGMMFVNPASAAPVVDPLVLKGAAQDNITLPNVETVRWRGGGWRGGGWRGGRGWGYGHCWRCN